MTILAITESADSGVREHAVDELSHRVDLPLLEVSPGCRDLEPGDGLVGASGGDAIVVQPIGPPSPASLADIESDGARRIADLCRELPVPGLKSRHRHAKGANDFDGEVENFEAPGRRVVFRHV